MHPIHKDRPRRAMWLLNHSAARRFEVPMLKAAGIREIFLPKIYPDDPNFRSASIDFSEDKNLTIPAGDLLLLNETDWYRGGTKAAWEVANRHFDLAFAIMYYPELFEIAQQRFSGAFLWRTYGLSHGNTYSKLMADHAHYGRGRGPIHNFGERFWFAEGYPHLHEIEDDFLSSRAVFLPLGMNSASNPKFDEWRGTDRRILFVCPDIGYNQIYQDIYKDFKRGFGDLPYVIGGAQPIKLDDPHILGYLPAEEHARNMREMRVMFYHSSEPRHIHFHPFEAVAAGMPLVFMSGGILDRLGGKRLPGRCKTIAEARAKIERILGGDQRLIDSIRKSQPVLLNEMKPENCVAAWVSGVGLVLEVLDAVREGDKYDIAEKPKKIGVLCTKRNIADGIRVSEAFKRGAESSGERVDIVIGLEAHDDDRSLDLLKKVSSNIRPFEWEKISYSYAKRVFALDRTMRVPVENHYVVPNDGINYFCDCDLWVVVGPSSKTSVLPVRPLVIKATDKHPVSDESSYGIELSAKRVLADDQKIADQLIGLKAVPSRKIAVLPPLKSAPEDVSREYWSEIFELL